jgi:hypothetical protein
MTSEQSSSVPPSRMDPHIPSWLPAAVSRSLFPDVAPK